jgi:hypothetical protein
MLQGDQDWWSLARVIADEDRLDATAYNTRAATEHRLYVPLGPVPCVGAVMTAPVVLLLSRPLYNLRSTADDYAFRREGWPLSALHRDAPSGLAEWWRSRVAALVEVFGAQHVSNAVAAVYLTPWHSSTFDERLRLPSRARMLDLGASAARRDAVVILMQGAELWTEHADIASLPTTRCVRPRSWRGTELSRRNLGEAWTALCKRIEVHAWL